MIITEGEAARVVLLASRFDVSCDYVVSKLRSRSVSYLRINSEDMAESEVVLDPLRRQLSITLSGGDKYIIEPELLRSVYFRRPVFLREYGNETKSTDEMFCKTQWAAFLRNLMIFEEAHWINDPTATYRAEHKALQLAIAAELGFAVPDTRITNAPVSGLLGSTDQVAIKGLDTILVRSEESELFGYTTFDSLKELNPHAWRSAPATFQVALRDKLDVRVTVVGDQVFSAEITVGGYPVCDDWRIYKNGSEFREHCLPVEVANRCKLLVRSLGLVFGGIDLAFCDGVYFFLEINPTGEWAWLVDSAGLPIDEAIAEILS